MSNSDIDRSTPGDRLIDKNNPNGNENEDKNAANIRQSPPSPILSIASDRETSADFMTAKAPVVVESPHTSPHPKIRTPSRSSLKTGEAPKRMSRVKFSPYCRTWSKDGKKGRDKVKITDFRRHSAPIFVSQQSELEEEELSDHQSQ